MPQIIRREFSTKRYVPKFPKPEDGAWVCMSAEVPVEDECGGDIIRVAGLKCEAPEGGSIKMLAQHKPVLPDGSPGVVGKIEETKEGHVEWKGKLVPAKFARFSWAKDGEGHVTDLASKYKSLWDGGYLDSVSVGVQVDKYEPIDPKNPFGGYDFQETRLFELSIVTIPANPAATVLRAIADTFDPQPEPIAATIQSFDYSDSFDAIRKEIVGLSKSFNSRLDDLESAIAEKADGPLIPPSLPQNQPDPELVALAKALKAIASRS